MSAEAANPVYRPPEGMLSPEQYQLLAGPALKAAAQVAASRNDPDLFHDMASMLALLAMVTSLVRRYQAQADDSVDLRTDFDAVPIAVCALVFARSGLEPDQVRDCLEALPRAYQMLQRDGALGTSEVYVGQAFDALVARDAPAAEELLLQAAHAMVVAVDEWEWQRSEPAN